MKMILLFTLTSSFVVNTSRLFVASPSGGETYLEGSDMTVTWLSKGISQSEQVKIVMYYTKYNHSFAYILGTSKNDGHERVTLPTKLSWNALVYEKVYKVSIVTKNDTAESLGFFSVTYCTPPPTAFVSTLLPTIFVGNGDGINHYYTIFNYYVVAMEVEKLIFSSSTKGMKSVLYANKEYPFRNRVAVISGLHLSIPANGSIQLTVSSIYDTVPQNGAAGDLISLNLEDMVVRDVLPPEGMCCVCRQDDVAGGVQGTPMVLTRSHPAYEAVQPRESAQIGQCEFFELYITSLNDGYISQISLPINIKLSNAIVDDKVNNITVKDSAGVIIPTTNLQMGAAISGATDFVFDGAYTINFASLLIKPHERKLLKFYLPVTGKKYNGDSTHLILYSNIGIGNNLSWQDRTGQALYPYRDTTFIYGYPYKTVFEIKDTE